MSRDMEHFPSGCRGYALFIETETGNWTKPEYHNLYVKELKVNTRKRLTGVEFTADKRAAAIFPNRRVAEKAIERLEQLVGGYFPTRSVIIHYEGIRKGGAVYRSIN